MTCSGLIVSARLARGGEVSISEWTGQKGSGGAAEPGGPVVFGLDAPRHKRR